MATIKSYTDLDKSKKLAKILPIDTADMEYMFLKKDGSKVSNVPFVKDGFEEPECCYTFIPCWSLAALLEVIKTYTLQKIDKDVFVIYEGKKVIGTEDYDNPVDACYELILKLNELKML